MSRQAIDVSVRFERASATPEGEARQPARHPHHRAKAVEAQHDGSLRGQQQWFSRAIFGPDEAVDVEERLTPGPSLGARERLDIYRRGYLLRLLECLADDYPAVQHALGEERFEALCTLYIEQHPSQGPNLNVFGRHMEAFCRGPARSHFRDAGEAGFIADLAALEWAIVEVIHAPSEEPLTLEGLGRIAPDAWGEVRLVPNTSVRQLRFDYPVNAYFQACRGNETPDVPAAERSMLAVYRSGRTIWRQDLTAPMYEVLSALVAKEKLGHALARAESALKGLDQAQAMQQVSQWFRDWVSSGLFVGVKQPGDEVSAPSDSTPSR